MLFWYELKILKRITMIMTEICNNVYYLESNKRMRRTFNSYLDLYQTLFRTPLCLYYILPYILFILTQLDFELFKGKEIIFIFVLFSSLYSIKILSKEVTIWESKHLHQSSTLNFLPWDFREIIIIDSRTRILELKIIKKNYCT